MTHAALPPPIGVFDSGLGGLTVVREILRESPPSERIVYVGDTAHVPYGPRPCAEIRDFSLAIGRYLIDRAGCRAIVVACNTATASGVDALRDAFPHLPIIGMEPGVKPAAALTHTGRVAVLATASTLSADRFAGLVARFGRDVTVVTQPCPGWVECVERGDLTSPETRALVERVVAPLIASGVDTLVLGCTHYPLLRPLIEQIAGPGIAIVDTGPAVARHVVRVVGDLSPRPPLPVSRLGSLGEGESKPSPHSPSFSPSPREPKRLTGRGGRGERSQGATGSLHILTTAPNLDSAPTARAILAGAGRTVGAAGIAGISPATAIQFGSVFWKNGELTYHADTAN